MCNEGGAAASRHVNDKHSSGHDDDKHNSEHDDDGNAGHNKHGTTSTASISICLSVQPLRQKRATKTTSSTVHKSRGKREPASNRPRLRISIKS
jgi:hypothetical protein